MMDLLTADDFHRLLTAKTDPAVSIYLPTHRAGAEAQQDKLRCKNLVEEAEHTLIDRGVRPAMARTILGPARDLLTDSTFWAHQETGLAVFASEGSFESYRLPIDVPESVRVAAGLHLVPLAPLVGADAEFHVLALSQNRVRLLHGTRFGVSEIELRDVPVSLAEALWFEDRERQLQHRPTGPVGRAGVAAVFHGHGLGETTMEDEIERFFRAVDDGIRQIVDVRVPVVLAGVAYLFPIYRRASRHPSIVDGGVEGNHEHLSPAELHQRALPVVEPLFDREQADALARYTAGVDPTASTIEEVVLAAKQARVECAFLGDSAPVWGRIHDDSMRAEVYDEAREGAVDLHNEIAVDTWLNGGRVFLVDAMPNGARTAALLRF